MATAVLLLLLLRLQLLLNDRNVEVICVHVRGLMRQLCAEKSLLFRL